LKKISTDPKDTTLMSAYVIADVTVTDAEQMAQYREWSTKAAAEFGATFIVRGGAITVFEGDWKPRVW
jgi:uncharacterized protein (DUF1330 family)